MKKIKNTWLVGLLALGLGVSAAQAQVEWKSFSFIPENITSLLVSNTLAVTNLSTASAQTTNANGTVYTNTAGVRVILNANQTTKLLQDVPLWSLRDGGPAWESSTNGVNYIQSYAQVSVSTVSGSGANAALSFVVTPIYGNSRRTGKSFEATVSTEEWTFAFTPTASSSQTFTTNAPLYRWPGAKGLRLRRVINADTDASSDVWLQDISLNGYVPTGN